MAKNKANRAKNKANRANPKRRDEQSNSKERRAEKRAQAAPANVVAQLPGMVEHLMRAFMSQEKDGSQGGILPVVLSVHNQIELALGLAPESTEPGMLQIRMIDAYCKQMIEGHSALYSQLHSVSLEVAIAPPEEDDEEEDEGDEPEELNEEDAADDTPASAPVADGAEPSVSDAQEALSSSPADGDPDSVEVTASPSFDDLENGD